ncbi:type II toxin-antitoxin system PemK/MazF family toxin [Brachybacterium huguangmaarense]|uniref:Type II toxin-antitoxin system PemK/MazF family toxin n=1 Tax=Brachybacterium huguangmaarense TaxID=1652028 RepID=A0ABY6FYY9_9MICO|nr:type II toxin-antitoxin system PemK/MazF family toxin [Brachybacterium huguangmaarense]UYG16160.1 type II toxin-antitoxin system PemK/MazF family toxin [Brachybacterium huguangmaarense]
MSLTSRLSALLGSIARSPEARRTARQVARRAGEALRGTPAPERRRTPEGARRPPATAGAPGAAPALRDRPSRPAPVLRYAPVDDDRADPGEIVWAWVPFEEDLHRGKDRPVLVLAREDAAVGGRDGRGEVLLALMLTSHDRGEGTHVDEHGHTWVDIGTGAWDRQGRPSEVRADRLLRIPADAVRREGSRLDAARFARVVDATRAVHGWER